MTENAIPKEMWDFLQDHFGYSNEEMELLNRDPRTARGLAVLPEMQQKTIVFEVIASHGCNCQHKVGARFFFTGNGHFITSMAPPEVCTFLMPVMAQSILSIQELWYAGADPNGLFFKRIGCFDVGIQCGGWGHVVVEPKIMDQEQAAQLFKQSREGVSR